MQAIPSEEESEANKVMLSEEALQSLEPVDKDLEWLIAEIDTITEYWADKDTELNFMNNRANTLRDGHMLQVKIKGLRHSWKNLEEDFIQYVNAVRVHA